MKTWLRPAAIGQHFAANDYVSACSIEVSCDYDKAKIPGWGYGLVVPEGVGCEGADLYFPCGHKLVIGADELHPCVFTQTASGPDNVTIGEFPAYYWIETKDDGSTDFHATSVSADVVEAALAGNKS